MFAGIAVVAIIAALAGFFLPAIWPAEIFLSLFPQMAAGGFLMAVAMMVMRRSLAMVLALCICALGTFGAREQLLAPRMPTTIEAGQSGISLIWANLYGDEKALQSVLRHAQQHGAQIVAMAEYPEGVSLDFTAAIAYPYRLGKGYGRENPITLFSTKPLDKVVFTPPGARGGVMVEVSLGDQVTALGFVHPTIPRTPSQTKARNRQLEAVFKLTDHYESAAVMGDFNAVPWSPALQRLTRPRELQRASAGRASTWLTQFPMLGLPLDQVYGSEDLAIQVRVGPFIGSDHRPLFVSAIRRPADQ